MKKEGKKKLSSQSKDYNHTTLISIPFVIHHFISENYNKNLCTMLYFVSDAF